MKLFRLLSTLVLAVAVFGCEGSETPAPPAAPASATIDTARVRSALEAAGWDYRQVVETDLDGDEADEKLILASDVAVRPDGTPLWDDGHRWALWAETKTGERTLLYGAFVPHGFAEVAFGNPDDRGRRTVFVHERSARELRLLSVDYEAAGKITGRVAGQWMIEAWMQDLPQSP